VYIRFDDAVEHLRKAVEVRGADWVYPHEWRTTAENTYFDLCQYAINGQPACIIGQVLFQLGLDLNKVDLFFGSVAMAFGMYHDVQVDPDAIELLQKAQDQQDNGVAWGKAVAQAIESTCSR